MSKSGSSSTLVRRQQDPGVGTVHMPIDNQKTPVTNFISVEDEHTAKQAEPWGRKRHSGGYQYTNSVPCPARYLYSAQGFPGLISGLLYCAKPHLRRPPPPHGHWKARRLSY